MAYGKKAIGLGGVIKKPLNIEENAREEKMRMIIFDSGETLLLNIGINAFSLIIAFIIFCSVKKDFADTYDIRLLRRIEITTLLVLLADMAMWLLNGKSGDFLRVLSYANTILYFLMQIVVVFWWLRYAWYRIFGQKMSTKKETFFVLAPFAFLSLIVVTSPVNGWCFYLDDGNNYHRGALSALMSLVILLYLLSVTVAALIQHKKEIFDDRKKELMTIAFFAAPPFLGGLAQTVFHGFSLVWPCVVISSLLILLNKESQAIAQDALTGLNNRRSMEKFLRTYEVGQIRTVALMMMDVNGFKHINDQYGHSTGDAALIQAANILRATFNRTSAFLARYGGDEFVVVLPECEERAVKEAAHKIRNGFEHFSNTKQLPFRLSVSIGYAVSAKKSDHRIAELFRKADENMYRDKALHQQERRPQS